MTSLILPLLLCVAFYLWFKLFLLRYQGNKLGNLWQEQANKSKTLSGKVFAQGMADAYNSGDESHALIGRWRSEMIGNREINIIKAKILGAVKK